MKKLIYGIVCLVLLCIQATTVYASDDGFDATLPTYPKTWDFSPNSSDWEKSIIEMQKYSSVWTHTYTTDASDNSKVTADEYRPTTTPSNTAYYVDLIRGLEFTGDICLDHLRGIWLAKGASITLRNLKSGAKVAFTRASWNTTQTFTASSTDGETTTSDNLNFVVTKAGDVTFTASDANHITGLAVTDGLMASTITPANNSTVTILDNNTFTIQFNHEVEPVYDANGLCTIGTVSDGTTTTTVYMHKNQTVSTDASIRNANNTVFDIPVTVSDGKTYTVTINAGVLKVKDGTDTNGEITSLFTIDASGNQLTMIAPAADATGTYTGVPLVSRIILNATDKDGTKLTIQSEDKDHKPITYKAHLKGGTKDVDLTLVPNGNQLVFTPTADQRFEQGTDYTLTLSEDIPVSGQSGSYVAKLGKSYTFSTMTPSGAAPSVQSLSINGNTTVNYTDTKTKTIPSADVQPTSGTLTVTFQNNITLQDGATVSCIPVHGDEGVMRYYLTAKGQKDITVSGNTLSITYSGTDLYNGMSYALRIPTYAISGENGQRLEKDIVFYFKTPKNSEAKDSRSTKYAPYTWDFTNFSDNTLNTIKSSVTSKNTFWATQTDNSKGTYYSSNNARKYSFPQDQEPTMDADGTVIPEFKGLLINLVKDYSSRFAIYPKSDKNTNSYFSLGGTTHYITIQNVNKGQYIYVERQDSKNMFNRNSLQNADLTKFNCDSIESYTNSSNHYVTKYQCSETGDITFCVQNLALYRIAVVKDFKKIGTDFNYSTYSIDYPVNYNYNSSLANKALTPYEVTQTSYDATKSTVTMSVVSSGEIASGEGVILDGEKNTSYPIFTTDVNTTPTTNSNNALVGSGASTVSMNSAAADGYTNYIFTHTYYNIVDGKPSGDKQTSSKQCFYRWVKGDLAANKCYLHLKTSSSAKPYITFLLDDVPTAIEGINAEADTNGDDAYYTLTGIRISRPSKPGMYIHQGKKILVK